MQALAGQGGGELLIRLSLFDEWQDPHQPGMGPEVIGGAGIGQASLGVVVDLKRQGHLLEIVAAGHPPRRLTRRLHGRQEQADEGGDDRDHHEQFDEGETDSGTRELARHGFVTDFGSARHVVDP